MPQAKFDHHFMKMIMYGHMYGGGHLPYNYKGIKPIFWEQRLDEQYQTWKQSMVDRDLKAEASLAYKKASAKCTDQPVFTHP